MEQVSKAQGSAGTGFDRAAAVTRSLLGYGVIAGPIYLVVGLAQALTRDGFDLTRHGLSLLANGPWGWVQVVNFIVTGLMVLAAAVGFTRAMRPARVPAALIAGYGGGLVLSGIFAADPMQGFPPGTPDGAPESMSLAGTLHLAAGGLGFLALTIGYFVLGRWFARRDQTALARGSWLSGAVVLAGFLSGAATATSTFGVAALWIAVLAGWGWLTVASLAVYRTVPHPDRDRRA